MHTDTIIAFVGVMGLLLGAAVIAAQFRVSRNTGATSAYRETALAYETMHKAKDAEIIELRTQNASQQAQLDAQNQKIQMLQDMVTSRTLIEALGRQLDTHFAGITDKLDAILAATQTGGGQ